MNNSKQFLIAARLIARQMSQTSQTEVVTPKFNKLKEIQKKFQVDDGLPVHIKGGLGDQMLYRATFALTIIGLGFSLETFYRLVFK